MILTIICVRYNRVHRQNKDTYTHYEYKTALNLTTSCTSLHGTS